MKISYSEETREDRQLDVLTDEENGLRIVVSRLGAELISLARINEAGNWTGFLYRDNDLSAPSKSWANHATVMGYYLHRLKNGCSLDSQRPRSKVFIFKCRRVFTVDIFRPAIICQAKRARSNSAAVKCRSRKANWPARSFSS